MKIAINQPYFMPYLGYWQLINAVDKFVIYDDVTFIKQGYINRNTIISNGKRQRINVCVKAISSSKLILDHELDSHPKWKEKLLITIKQNYSKAKYFNTIFPLIKECILYDEINLSKYLAFQIKAISKYLDINTQIIESSSIYPRFNLKGKERVFDICKHESAFSYINTIVGKVLYCKQEFKENDIDINFLKMKDVKYKQFIDDFVPSLSIIDVLMFNSQEKVKQFLCDYELV